MLKGSIGKACSVKARERFQQHNFLVYIGELIQLKKPGFFVINRYIFAGIIVFSAISALIYAAVNETARAVVTVDELLAGRAAGGNVRLGARVSDGSIEYRTDPAPRLKFTVHDIPAGASTINVVYHGLMPDTLRAGRDVILEGQYRDNAFQATSLLTQCPSKYEVPLPGQEQKGSADAGYNSGSLNNG